MTNAKDNKWRSERVPSDVGFTEALQSIVDRYGSAAVASRLDVDPTSIRGWLMGKHEAPKKTRTAVMKWWGESPQDKLDDATIYAVQALRIVQRECSIEGKSVSVSDLIQRMEKALIISTRALEYLSKQIHQDSSLS